MFRGTKSAPRKHKQDPPNTSFDCKADSSRNMAWPQLFPRRMCSPPKPLLFRTSSTWLCLSTSPSAALNFLAHCNFYHFNTKKSTATVLHSSQCKQLKTHQRRVLVLALDLSTKNIERPVDAFAYKPCLPASLAQGILWLAVNAENVDLCLNCRAE